MKIFVAHYSKLFDRKEDILKQFEKENITDFEFVEKYDKNEITEEEASLFVEGHKKDIMSLSLKHYYMYEEILAKYDCGLIFEDDVILQENFTEKLNVYVSQLPEDYDALFIGDGCRLHVSQNDIIPNVNVYKTSGSRCTDSYIVSKKCAKKLLEYRDSKSCTNQAIDWWLNYACKDLSLNFYWAEPTIATQGSQNGKYSPSLRC
jgi:GR25 family glycosyltransferase involved in LPS biosynthesis